MKNLITTILFLVFTSFAIAQGSLNSGLVAFYPFNGNANDLSGNGNNGAVNGALLSFDRYGNGNSAYQFNGTTDNITVPDNTTLDLTTVVSISAWVKRTRYGIDMILEKGGDWTEGTCNYGMSLHQINNNMFYFFFNGGWRGTDGVTDFEWHHYAVVAQHGSTNPLLYIDGQLKSVQYIEGSATMNLTSSALDLHIGAQLGTFPYYGANVLDEIRIYNRALTQDEISYLAGNGLVAFYPFSGNAIDITGNGHNGTVNGGILTNDRFNQQNNAYTFPNLHNNIVLDNSTNLNLESGFTLNAWIKYKNVDCGIVGKHNCWVINGFYFGISSSQIYLMVGNSGWSEVRTNEIFVEDKWYMVTGVFDSSSSTIKIYVNGQLKTSGPGIYNNFSSASMTISEASNGCPNGNMPGAIDEVKIYNRPLSDAEILAEYNSSNTDLIAYYPFNGNANDESGNNINPTYIGSGVTLTSDRFGLNNRAFYFDGNNGSYIRLNADSLPTTSRTISFWINSIDLTSGKVPFSYGGNGCNTSSFIEAINLSNNASYNVCGHCNQSLIYSTYSVPPLNIWKHWVITIEGSTQRLYIDGELKATENNYVGATYVAGRSAIIGGLIYIDGNTVYVDPNSGYFKGKIDDIRIYNHAITDQQVVELYNDSTTYTPPTLQDGLALFLPFNGNANDLSGNNNNGTISGASLTQDRFGVSNRAFTLDGIDDYISIAHNPNLFSDELTISWWYKMTEILGGERVVVGWVDGGHRYQQFFNGGQLSYLNGYNVGQPGMYFNPIYGLNDLNVWKHVVVTYKKLGASTSTTSVYVDGELKQTDNHTLAMDYATGPDFFIGKNHNGNFFKGYFDDLRIFNRNLSATEILALYQDSTTYQPELIDSVYPHQNSNYLTVGENIKVFFSQPMDESTFNYNSISTLGNITGSYELIFNYQSLTNTLEIQPTVPFKIGEQITVTLDSSIKSVSGYDLMPYVFQFKVKPEKGSVKFAVADSFQLNFPPINIVSGDFNNDGKIDVIVSNYDSSKYTILLNNGSGGFTLGEEMSGAFKPYSISFTDIENDRDLDMIVSTHEENKIRVLRATGQGTFTWILPTIDVNYPIATCPGDFDGDGDNDFVALCNTGNAIFYKNDGTGVFAPSGTTTINVPSTIRNIIGDIDNDGDLDIIGGTSDYSGVFKILENDGNGNFIFTGGPYLGPYPDELAGGDFDGDYDLDFIKCDWYQSGLGIGLNNGLGEFPVQNFLNLGNIGGQSRNPEVNDFDGDGDLDFVVTFNNNSLGIAKNNGHPNYELYLSYPIPGIKGLAAADFDNNGSVDLVGFNSTTNQIKFLKNCVDSLVAYYPFNGNANDESGNINNGVIHNATLEMDRYGNPNSTLFFAGDGYVEGINPGNNLPVKNSPRSFTAWVNTGTNNPSGSNIFHYGTSEASPTNFHFLVTNPAGLGNGYGYGVVYGNTNVADGFWHFVSGVYFGGTERTTKIYVDGKPDGSGTITTEPNTILNSNWSIGKFMSGFSSFSGYVDEIKVYNEVLSDEEVWNLYKATTTAPNLISPANNATINTLLPILQWDSLITAFNYRLELASDSTFASTLISEVVPQKTYQIQNGVLASNNNYYWRVRTATDGGVGPWSEVYKFRVVITGIEDEPQLPAEFALLQNYPNPFNPSTTITYHLPKTANVELKIYDVVGNEIATLVNEEKPAGVYNVQYTINNLQLSSGIYFYKLKAGDYLQTKKMILLK